MNFHALVMSAECLLSVAKSDVRVIIGGVTSPTKKNMGILIVTLTKLISVIDLALAGF